MAKKRVVVQETSGGGSSGGFGILGVVIGALVVVGIIFVFAGNSNMFAGKGAANSGPSVTINTPTAPRLPAPTTGSGNVR